MEITPVGNEKQIEIFEDPVESKIIVHVYEWKDHTGKTMFSAMIDGGWWVGTNVDQKKAIKDVVKRYQDEIEKIA